MKQNKLGELEFVDYEEAALYFALLLKESILVRSDNKRNQETYKKEIVELRNVSYSIPQGKVISGNIYHFQKPFWAISESLSEILNLSRPIMDRYLPSIMNNSYDMQPDRMPIYCYGERWHNSNQLINTFKRLDSNITTKRAHIAIFEGRDTELSRSDVPCTLGHTFSCRDNILDITAYMRSQDFKAGNLYDTFLANFLLQSFTSWLKNSEHQNVQAGKIHFVINSLHYYPIKCNEGLDAMIDFGYKNFYLNVESWSLNSSIEDYFNDLYHLIDAETASYNGNFSYAEDKLKKIVEPIFRDWARMYIIRNAKQYQQEYIIQKYNKNLEDSEMQKWFRGDNNAK